jgi:2-amino-4-hydroxy-6-hydroxymethyldihydropteridine diphosphokinase
MTILVGLGSNLGDRRATLGRAVALIEARGITITARSGLHETAPVGMDSDRRFLNAVIAVRTDLSPRDLLTTLLETERALGRERAGHTPRDRTCDLDLLLYDAVSCDEPGLVLPHPRMSTRRFVLIPLLEIAPELKNPVTGALFSDDLRGLDDPEQRCKPWVPPSGW